MKIEIEIKPMAEMRYPTVGDYYFLENGTLKIEIAETGVPMYNMMVLVHELVEYALITHKCIAISEIEAFDIAYEAEREQGFHDLDDEPGFDKRSPYTSEHTVATAVEMMMCAHAGIHWVDYNEAIITL